MIGEDTRFVRATSLLYELAILSEIGGGRAVRGPAFLMEVDETARQAYWAGLLERELISVAAEGPDGPAYRLTPQGENRLTYLLVDYLRELASLADVAAVHFRRRFAAMYVAGVRTVAFYPVGQTAEAAVAEIGRSGLHLVAAIDDDHRRWGELFHGLTIGGRETLAGAAPDALVITTAVFMDAVRRRVEELGIDGLRIYSL